MVMLEKLTKKHTPHIHFHLQIKEKRNLFSTTCCQFIIYKFKKSLNNQLERADNLHNRFFTAPSGFKKLFCLFYTLL